MSWLTIRLRGGARSRGFTLVEMLVVLAISAILLAVAIPQFRGSIAGSRSDEASRLLVDAMQLAQAEALSDRSNGNSVVVCRTADATAALPVCTAGAGNWGGGWVVWVDQNADGALDAADRIVRRQPALNGAAVGDGVFVLGGVGAITYGPQGRRVGATGDCTFNVFFAADATGTNAIRCRAVTVGLMGNDVANAIVAPCPAPPIAAPGAC